MEIARDFAENQCEYPLQNTPELLYFDQDENSVQVAGPCPQDQAAPFFHENEVPIPTFFLHHFPYLLQNEIPQRMRALYSHYEGVYLITHHDFYPYTAASGPADGNSFRADYPPAPSVNEVYGNFHGVDGDCCGLNHPAPGELQEEVDYDASFGPIDPSLVIPVSPAAASSLIITSAQQILTEMHPLQLYDPVTHTAPNDLMDPDIYPPLMEDIPVKPRAPGARRHAPAPADTQNAATGYYQNYQPTDGDLAASIPGQGQDGTYAGLAAIPGGLGTFPLGPDAPPPGAIKAVCALSDIPPTPAPASSFDSFSLAPVPVLPGVNQWKVTKNKKTGAPRHPRVRQNLPVERVVSELTEEEQNA